VLFEYEAQEENEINLVEGQLIINVEFIDDVPTTPSFPWTISLYPPPSLFAPPCLPFCFHMLSVPSRN
jgi:hypothetical protein